MLAGRGSAATDYARVARSDCFLHKSASPPMNERSPVGAVIQLISSSAGQTVMKAKQLELADFDWLSQRVTVHGLLERLD